MSKNVGEPKSLHDLAYPSALREAEEELLKGKHGRNERPPPVGLALSGGGIRSATFCLGAMQWLARRRLLSRIDFLSTVSGGGYFGAFLGRLFTRKNGEGGLTADEVEKHLDPHPESDPHIAPRGVILRWLRENGRYLAPKGSGDLLLGGAVLVRNLLSVHFVLFVALLSLWLGLQTLRDLAVFGIAGAPAWITGLQPYASFGFWWPSPYLWLAIAVVLFYVVPAAAAYWALLLAVRSSAPTTSVEWSWKRAGGLVVFAIVLGGFGAHLTASTDWHPPFVQGDRLALIMGGLLSLVSVQLFLALIFAWFAWRIAQPFGAPAGNDRDEFDIDAYARHWVSDRLSKGLLAVAVVIVVAMVDSLGQSLYLAISQSAGLNLQWLTGLSGSLLAVGIAARRILVTFAGQVDGERLSLPVGMVAQAAGILLALLLLLFVNLVSHAIIWGFESPTDNYSPRALRLSNDTLGVAALTFGVALVFTTFFGRQTGFINASTHQPLYTARLARAYLGASNPTRHRGNEIGVTQVVADDDIIEEEYWPLDAAGSDRWTYAPLHLINVTINETCDGRSQIQQQDRKGIGMAIGPCGLSVGVRHHLVRSGEPRTLPDGKDEFKVFDGEANELATEKLSLGQWSGISGAAFSTGLGARTNLGLSLLLGLANIRLGYWWDSGVRRFRDDSKAAATSQSARPSAKEHMRQGDSWVRRVLPVYCELFDEFTARFRGTALRRWYLTDGGHFENLGGYELIRRRLATIILIDAEADPDGLFEGFAELVRKARIDFGAEIQVLDEEELDTLLKDDSRRYVGSLTELRRGRWSNEPFDEPSLKTLRRPRQVLEPPDRRRHSRAHAVLARVFYEGSTEPGSWLLYIKATMTGDEPADLLEYHANHRDFPHQSTANQFFDEAQWESYRRLGEHILSNLLPEDGQLNELLGLSGGLDALSKDRGSSTTDELKQETHDVGRTTQRGTTNARPVSRRK